MFVWVHLDFHLQKYKNRFFGASRRVVGVASEESQNVNGAGENLTCVNKQVLKFGARCEQKKISQTQKFFPIVIHNTRRSAFAEPQARRARVGWVY